MREHGVIFSCSEADDLRMIWDNDTVGKKEKRSGSESSALLAGNSYIKLILWDYKTTSKQSIKRGF